MGVKDLMRPVPGVGSLSVLRQRLKFNGSAGYWDQHYAEGGTSGEGSYGALGEAKARFLNDMVRRNGLSSVIEFGCGDGHQLSLADYPHYVGLDVSRAAIELCKIRFARDKSKSFFLYDGACFVDNGGLFDASLALSLDVIYHLVEDHVFETYMTHLFSAGTHYVVIYATDIDMGRTAPHVRHRQFSSWVADNCPLWQLTQVEQGPNGGLGRADFYVYRRLISDE